MELLTGSKLLPIPVHMKPYIVGHMHTSLEERVEAFGEQHFTETDPTRTCGGIEYDWAWELSSGHRDDSTPTMQ